MALLIAYTIFGAIFFGISQFLTFFKRDFKQEPINWEEMATLFVWLFLLWPFGVGALLFVLLSNKNKR